MKGKVAFCCLLLVASACARDPQPDATGLPAVLPGHDLELLESELLADRQGVNARMTLFEDGEGNAFGLASVRGDRLGQTLGPQLDDHEVRDGESGPITLGRLPAGEERTFNAAIVDAEDESRIALSQTVDLSDLAGMVDTVGPASDAVRVASADATFLMYGSFPPGGEGCLGVYGTDDPNQRAAIGFWPDEDPLPVYAWWFGERAQASDVAGRPALHVEAQFSQLVVWSATGSIAAALNTVTAVDAEGALEIAEHMHRAIVDSTDSPCLD